MWSWLCVYCMLKGCDVVGSGGDKLDKFSCLSSCLYSYTSVSSSSLLSLVFVFCKSHRVWHYCRGPNVARGKTCCKSWKEKNRLLAKSEVRTTMIHVIQRSVVG
jgi:hypothetical protein